MRLREVLVSPTAHICRFNKAFKAAFHGFYQQTAEEGNETPIALIECTTGEVERIPLNIYDVTFTGNLIVVDADTLSEFDQTLTNAELANQHSISEYSQLPVRYQNGITRNIATKGRGNE
ncbi:MAG: hypothetical protein JNL32_02360 [Candidatus Kapabacteria bacterium]|nr:hypothetical protein [Candidatus Kapabacteria bacterium]